MTVILYRISKSGIYPEVYTLNSRDRFLITINNKNRQFLEFPLYTVLVNGNITGNTKITKFSHFLSDRCALR